jgi:hypothetical protein
MSEKEKFMTAKEAAELVSLPPNAIRKGICACDIPTVQHGKNKPHYIAWQIWSSGSTARRGCFSYVSTHSTRFAPVVFPKKFECVN